MPRDIEGAFTETRLSLFPTDARDLSTDCSCPDWANIRASTSPRRTTCSPKRSTGIRSSSSAGADAIRDELLAHLLSRPSGTQGRQGDDLWDVPTSEARPLAGSIDRFWDAGHGIDTIVVRPRAATVPDGILRALQPGTLEAGGRSIVDVLAPAYATFTRAAERRALKVEPG